MSEQDIGLAEMIVQLRGELRKAQCEGEKQDLRFRVDEIEAEIQVTVTKDVKAGGGVKFWVFNAEAAGTLGHASVQKLRLKLKPLTRGDDGEARSPEIDDLDEKPSD